MLTLKGKLILIFTVLSLVQCTTNRQLSKNDKKNVREQLANMLSSDQKYRMMLMYGEADKRKLDSILQLPFDVRLKILRRHNTPQYGLSKVLEDSLWKMQNKIDSVNAVQLKTIIARYGWPDEKRFGENKANIILIHAAAQKVKELHSFLLEEVKLKRLRPFTFATIWDRMLTHSNQKQLYGTIPTIDIDGKTLQPLIENVDSTNKARRLIGLRPIKKYRISE